MDFVKTLHIDKIKEEGKDQESIPSITRPDPMTSYGKVTDNTINNHIQESQEVTTRLQETDSAVWQRQTQITKKIPKRSTALEQSVKNTCELKLVSWYQPHP